MNDKIVITDSTKFENLINEFEISCKKISDIFVKEKNNIEKINATETWTSKTQEVVYNKHVAIQKNFDPIVEALNFYVLFLKKSLNDYIAWENRNIELAENNKDELDVNN